MTKDNELYIGIDLEPDRAMVSLFHTGMKEPETVSTVPGEERYRIPTAIFMTKQGTCYYGEEALRREHHTDGEFYDGLYERALHENEGTLYHNLLVQFLRRLIRFRERCDFGEAKPCVAVTVPEISPETAKLFSYVREQLELSPEQFVLMDHGESFYAHTYHQDPSIWLHDVALFDFAGGQMQFLMLHRSGHGPAQIVSATGKKWRIPGEADRDLALLDEFFANVLRESFVKRIISGVYFVGDGFDGGWMRESLRMIGPNKRVFLGKNLYTRGACLAAYRRNNPDGWNLFYDCPYKMQGEINMKIRKGGEITFLKLAEAGKNWFDPTDEYFMMIDGEPKFEVWIRSRGQLSTRIRTFFLEDLPERPPETIRLKVQTLPQSGNDVLLRISDDGFGELFASSGKVWDFPLDIQS